MITYNTLPADICSVAKEGAVAVGQNNAIVVLETFLVSRRRERVGGGGGVVVARQQVHQVGGGGGVVARQQVHREEAFVLRTCQVQRSHCYVISGNVDN